MLRKTLLALGAAIVLSAAPLSTGALAAHGGGHMGGGGGHWSGGGGGHWGGGGGWSGGRFGGRFDHGGFGRRNVFAFGFGFPFYDYGYGYGDYGPYAYDYGSSYDPGCFRLRRSFYHGYWHVRRVWVCG